MGGQTDTHDNRGHRRSARKKLRGAPVRLAGVVRRSRRALLLGTALQATVVLVLALPARAQLSPGARPTGGTVVGGAAIISQTQNATNIDQTTQRAAINWQSFDVGSGQSVNFQQPNAAAVALNRVVGPNPSQIAGQINANGQVILENQDGITFTKGAQINTAGFIATAAGITNQNFMAGHMVFDQPAAPGAAVVNRGRITVTQAGIAALVAPQVANSGIITARLGHVVLAGATRFTLDLYGDGLVSIDVTGAVRQIPVGPHGATVPALVTNTGTILAAGGQIELTARAAAGLVQELVSAGGKISAPSVGAQTGQVVLNGIGGSIVVAGALLAQGTAPGTSGGQIEVAPAGGDVRIASGAVVDASGQAGGGTVAIGTDLARAAGGPLVAPHVLARNVTVARGATIAANATASGHGGRVTVLAGEQTVMDGAISAAGGPLGGDGGFVEVSGQSFAYGGAIDAGAAFGHAGQILFDPGTLDIVNGGSGSGSLDGSLGTIAFGAGGTLDTISNGAINAFGATADVVLQATTLLDVQASVSVAHNLTMQSGGNLLVDAGVTIDAGTRLSLGAGIGTTGNPTQAGGITLGGTTGTTALLNAGTIVLQGGTSGGIALAGVSLATTLLDASTAGGGITQAGSGAIGAGILQSTSGIAGGLSLIAAGNSIATIGSVAVTGGDFVVNEAGAAASRVTVAGPVSARNVAITGAGTLLVAGSILPTTQAFLGASGGGGVTISAGGTVGTGGTTTVSLQGDAISLVSGGTINAGTIEVASFSTTGVAATITLGGGTSSLGLASLVGQGETLLRIGAVTPVGGTLTTTAQSIAVAGSFGTSTVSLELDSTGGITEGTSGTLTAASLAGHAGGTVNLGNVNAIPILGNFAVSGGDFLLDEPNTVGLTVTGQVSAAHIGLSAGAIDMTGAIVPTTQAFLSASDTNGIAITGSVGATGALVGLQGDKITLSGGGTITAGTIEAAPFSTIGPASKISLGATTDPLNLATLVGEGETLLRIGAVSSLVGGPVITATSINVAHAFGLAGVGLELDANGPITEGNAGNDALTAASLTGIVVGGSVFLNESNAIATLGSFTVTGGDFTLADTGSLGVSGPVTAPNVAITAGTMDMTGSIAAGTAGGLRLQATTGTLGIDPGALLTAGTIGLSASGAGVVIGSGGTAVVNAGTLLAFAGTGVTETATGTIIAGSLISTPNVTGAVLLTGSNTIASIPTFAVADGAFTLDEASGATLGVTGKLDATGITIAGPGSLAISGTIGNNDGPITLSAGAGGIALTGTGAILGGNLNTVDLTSTGGITEASTAKLEAASLQSSGGVTGTIDLAGSLNAIAQINTFVVTGGDATFIDQSAQTLNVNGLVSAAGHRLAFAIDAVTFGTSGSLVAGTVALAPATVGGTLVVGTGTSGLVLSGADFAQINAGEVDLGSVDGGATTPRAGAVSIGATVALGAGGTLGLFSSGTIVEAAGGTLIAGTVLGQANGAALGNANTIATLGSFSAGTGALVLTDTGTLTVSGPVSGQSVTLDPAAIVVTGTISAGSGGTLALDAGTSGITLGAGSALQAAGATVDLSALGAGVTQLATGLIAAGTLLSANGVTGTVDLVGANTIGALGGFTVTAGDLVLADGGASSLAVPGGVLANNVTIGLAGNAPGRISVNGGTIALNAGGTTIALNAGTSGITLAGGGLANAGGGTIALGATGGGVTTTTGTLMAGSLVSAGTITGTALLNGGSNAIATLGSFAVAGGGLTLVGTGSLAVAGPVSGVNVAITAGTLGVAGKVTATGATGSVALTASTGALDLNAGAIVSGPTVALSTGSLGAIAAGASINAPTLLELGGAGFTEASAAIITAGSLVGLGALTGAVDLAGTLNAIAGLGSFTVTGAGLTLIDGGSALLAVTGPVDASGGILLSGASTIAVSGQVGNNDGPITLASGSGGIALTGTGAILGGNLNTVDLSTTGGGITEASTAKLVAATLQSSGSIIGAVVLPSAANAIADLSNFVVTGGDVTLVEQPAQTLGVIGSVSAAGHHIGIATDAITFGTGASIVATSFALAPATSGGTMNLGALLGGNLAAINAGTIDFGSLNSGASIAAGAITIATDFALGAGSQLDLYSTGTIIEVTGGTLGAGTLAGQGQGVNLGNANTIATLGSFAAGSGTLVLADTGTLTVAGSVSGQSVTLDPAAIVVTGTISAASGGTLALDAGTSGITLGASSALRAAGATVDLSALGAGVTQLATGIVLAGTLLSANGVTGTVDLTGANTIGALGGFTVTAGDLVLADAGASSLAVPGRVVANNVTLGVAGAPGTIALGAGTIALNAGGTMLALDAGAGGITLGSTALLNAGSGTLALGTPGGVNEAGTIIAGTLVSLPTLGATANLTGSNTIAVLGGFTVAGGDLALADGGAATLTVPGTVLANNVTIGAGGAPGTLDINGGTIALTGGSTLGSTLGLNAGAGGITLAGAALVNAGGGTVALGTTGGVVEAATATIASGTLVSTGSIGGTAVLAGANTIAVLTQFLAGGLTLDTAGSLTVLGTVAAGGTALAGNTATLLLNTGSALALGTGGSAGTLIGGVVSLIAGGTIAETNGVVAANTLVASGAGGVSLLGASNTIGSFGNVAATGSGSVLLADTAAATVTGTISAPGSVYLQDTNPGGVGIATGGSMAVGSTATVGVQTDLFTNSGAISGGTFELAPNTTGSLVSLGTTGGPGLSLLSLAGISTTTVRIGRITSPGGTAATTAGSIVVAGAFGAAATALDLETTGAISESAAGALTAGALTANATAITLASSANAITLAQGISASAGDVTLVDGANLTLAGTIGGNNLFVEVAATGGTLALGSATTAPVLQASTGGRISLVADRMTEGATTGATIAAAGGLVQLAPYTSRTRVSLHGVAGAQLLLDPTLLGEIGTAQLTIGGFTNIPAGGAGTITAGIISVDGAVTLASAQATTLDLLSQGGIVEPAGGVLTLGTLIGSIVAGAVALGGPNAVGTLGAFAAPGASFALTDAGSLAVTGPVTAGGVTLTAGTLGVASAITAAGGTVALFSTAGTVGIDAGTDITGAVVTLASVGGTIGVGMGGTALVDATSLLALGGPGVNETATGTVIAGSLGGAGALTGTVDFSLGSNTIAAIGAIAITGGDLVLSDPVSTLTLSGPASATNVTIGGGALGTPGAIVIPGTIGANNNLNLTAGSGGITVSGATAAVTGPHIALVTPGTIALNAGTVSAGTTGTVTLGGSLGITEAPGAVLIAGLLQDTGAITGAVALDGIGNDVVTLGGFAVSGADFALSDAAPTLTVAGPLSAQNATIGGGALSAPGSLVVSGDITTTGTLLSLASGPNGMTLGGTIVANGGQVALSAAGGPIAFTGSLSAATLTPSNVTNITESGAVLTVTSLVGGSAINGNVILTGPSNAIGTLGNFAAGNTLAINASGSLAVTGPVQGADVTIAATGSLGVAGGVTALGATGTVALSGNGLGLSGGSISAATAILNGGAGGVTIAANGITPSTIGVTTLALDGAGATEDAASRITAATLISDLGVTGSINLAGSLNAIASIGRFAETGGSFALTDTGNLALTGPFSAPAIAVTTGGTGQVTASGTVSATAGTLAVTSGSGGIVLGTGALLTGAPVVLNAGGGPITLVGSARLGQSGEHIALIAGTGGISEATTSQILSGALTGTTTGVVTLVGANAITGLGSFTAAGGLTLDDGGDLTVTGPVSAGPSAQFTVAGALTFSGPLLARTAQLNAGALAISALIDAPDQVALAVSGSAGESGAGAIATALLTGSSGAATNLSGPNTVSELTNFTAGTMLTLDNAAPLLVAGTIRAPTMVITTTPYQVTIAGGTNLITGGIARPTSPLASDTFPTPAQGGAYFSDFQSLGAFTVGAPGGGPSILRIDAYNGGSVTFGGTGVNGPNTWLIIDLHGVGAGLGTASGPITIAALNVVFPAGSAGGGASFSGAIGGLAGQGAAGAGQIVPNPDSRFRFDSCAIGSVNCIVLPLEVLPIGNPLQEFSIGSLLNQDDDDDLFLPLVSRRDY